MTHAEREARRKTVADLVEKGMPIGEVCRLYDVSRTYVVSAHSEFYPDFSEAKRKQGEPRGSKTIRIISELMRTTDRYADIAQRVGVSYQRVQEVAAELRSESIRVPERRKNGN